MSPLLAQDFTFELPPERIAQTPRRRGTSRLLVLPKSEGPIRHGNIRDVVQWLNPGDCLVVNDTKVIPARLHVLKPSTGAKIEVLLHREQSAGQWDALVRPYKRVHAGTVLAIGDTEFKVVELRGEGRVVVDFGSRRALKHVLKLYGEPPLPPYIQRRGDVKWAHDRRRYQTVFASAPGSVAAPTAGLHFSEGLLKDLRHHGVRIHTVTLHVGWGTFSPLPEGDVSGVNLHPEYYHIPEETVAAIAQSKKEHKRVVACGTTVTRALESAADKDGILHPGSGETRIFIYPGYRWKVIDGLLTNFHLSGTSLLMLVCALAGKGRVLDAYQEAITQKYNFYSYGDAMLLL